MTVLYIIATIMTGIAIPFIIISCFRKELSLKNIRFNYRLFFYLAITLFLQFFTRLVFGQIIFSICFGILSVSFFYHYYKYKKLYKKLIYINNLLSQLFMSCNHVVIKISDDDVTQNHTQKPDDSTIDVTYSDVTEKNQN